VSLIGFKKVDGDFFEFPNGDQIVKTNFFVQINSNPDSSVRFGFWKKLESFKKRPEIISKNSCRRGKLVHFLNNNRNVVWITFTADIEIYNRFTR